MPTHPGQISFPGGRHDPGDKDLTATALREINEELGVTVKDIEVIGKIDDVPTPVGFVITPVVGWLRNPAVFSIDEREVAEYFEVDVKELSNSGNSSTVANAKSQELATRCRSSTSPED